MTNSTYFGSDSQKLEHKKAAMQTPDVSDTGKHLLMYIRTGQSVALVVGAGKLLDEELDQLWVRHETLQAGVQEASVAEITQPHHARSTSTSCTKRPYNVSK